MRTLVLIICLSAIYSGFCQKTVTPLRTTRCAGIFGYGSNVEKGPVGQITIYPESDSTILFYFESNRGGPSYNMGALYGRVKLLNDSGVFFQKTYPDSQGCKFAFTFTKEQLTLTSIDDFDDCGFGHGVYAQGKFIRTSHKVPLSFTDPENKEVFFKKTGPEDYNKY